MSYADKVEIRDIDIQGETNWHWVKSDTGCFGDASDGPMRDWIEGHSIEFFKYLKATDCVVTGGTSCGMYARFYAKKFKQVIAFEPDPLSFHCMVNNCPYDNVVKLNAAIGHQHGMIGIVRPVSNNIGMNHLSNVSDIMIPMMTIDSLGLSKCDLIQLDVEGCEAYAVAGAKHTIQRCKPVITGERFNSTEAQALMDSLGYRLVGHSFMDTIYVPKEG